MDARLCRVLLVFGVLATIPSCCCPRPRCRPAEPVVVVRPASDLDARIEAAADAVLAQARAAEPDTTAFVKQLAADAGGEVVGLMHRMKTRKATIGKFGRVLEQEKGKTPEEVVLYDALRYTILVPDEPPGHHDASVRDMLAAIEARGDSVEKVKNYWPRGDSYSGTNTVLKTADGLSWELQFHTAESYEVKGSTHTEYERMRAPDTPRAEKRTLFEQMSRIWDRIPIPHGILEPGSLHSREQLLTIPAP